MHRYVCPMAPRSDGRLGAFATLRHSVTAQFARYALAGAITLMVGAGTVMALTAITGMAIQLAIFCSYPLLITMHFSLQRHFVFPERNAFTLTTSTQLRRYLVICAGHYACVAVGTAGIARLTSLSSRAAYLIMVATMPLIVFMTFRRRVFH